MRLILIVVVTWTSAVATSKSDSHENWSNEKKGNQATSENRQLVQIVQPYVGKVEKKSAALEAVADELARPVRTSTKSSNDTVAVEYFPSRESRYEEPDVGGSESFDSAEFGQRVRSSFALNERDDERPKSKISLGGIGSDFRETVDLQNYYGGRNLRARRPFSSSFHELNDSESTKKRPGIAVSPLEDLYRVPAISTRENDSRENIEDDRGSNADYYDYARGGKEEGTYLKDEESREESQETIGGEHKSRNSDAHESESLVRSNRTRVSNRGKLSRPIVVPELPGYKTTSYSVTKDYSVSNDAPSTGKAGLPNAETNRRVVETSRSKIEENYLASSAMILNPLRVGVSLVNAQEPLNGTRQPPNVLNEYITDDPEYAGSVDSADSKRTEKNESGGGSYEIEFPDDQLLQQEQLTKEVTQESPVQSVEIEKSVEVYHTAPVQEIHYPPEYVPNSQQNSGKSRHESSKDSSHAQQSSRLSVTRDRRPSQASFGVYKSNEILEENIVPPPVQQQERNRYDYNGNENDAKKVVTLPSSPSVIYIPVGGLDRNIVPTIEQSLEKNHAYRARDQFDDTLHEQSSIRHSLSGIPTQLRGKLTPIRQEVGKELNKRVPEFVNPGIDFLRQESVHSTRAGQMAEKPVNVINLEGNNQEIGHLLMMKLPQPYPVEQVVEKTLHVPHTVEVEKLIEKKVPYPVEKVIEKQVTIPQPFPVHIQVPVDRIVEKQIRIPHLYPIHIERVIEKKVPFAVQRFVIQPYPVHVPVPIEKVIEKAVHVPRPYPVELAKYAKPLSNQQSYNQQQINLPAHYQTTSVPNYGHVNDEDEAVGNTSQFYGNPFSYAPQSRPSVRQPVHHQISKKLGSYGNYHSYSGTNAYSTLLAGSGSFRRQGVQVNVEKEKAKEDYGRGGHPHRSASGPHGIQSKSSQSRSPEQLLVKTASFRRARQEGGTSAKTGTFRQSKMEYGFKPPMVPSVQYDEKTAEKVDR